MTINLAALLASLIALYCAGRLVFLWLRLLRLARQVEDSGTLVTELHDIGRVYGRRAARAVLELERLKHHHNLEQAPSPAKRLVASRNRPPRGRL